MPSTDDLQFEMQRRAILFNSGTTMPDNINVLGYEGNPNLANTSTSGQTLLYNSPRGTSYIELVNGNLWYKQQIPNTWINLTSGSGSGSFSPSGNNFVYVTGDQTISGVKTFATGVVVSGNLQVANTGIFNALDLNNIDVLSFSGVDISITSGNIFLTNRPTVNGTGVLLIGEIPTSTLPATIVYTTGNQNISGTKNFYSRPTVDGTGVLLSGEAASLPSTIVYTTGNQTISGVKTFITGIIAPNLVYNTGDQTISGNKTFANNLGVQGTGIFNALGLSNISEFNFSGTDINLINGNVYISGGTAYISGNPVLTGVNLSSYATTSNLALTGLNLSNSIDSLSGLFTGYTGTLDATYATDLQLLNTGITLNTKINNLSGYINSTSSNIVFTTGNQSVSGNKTFINNIEVQGTGIFNALDLSNISEFNLSGTDINLINGNVNISGGTLNLNNNKIINAVPDLINTTSNFFISGNSNSRMILGNNSSEITGVITSGNATGFNTSIIQIGAGQIKITGSGIGIGINSYNNQYKTAGQFATISLLHTGNNQYIMYGNTAL